MGHFDGNRWYLRMDTLEIVAAVLGVINVTLVVRRTVWNYPFGIAMVTLYGFIFYDAKLYSDALLQIFFLVVQLYGWWHWARAPKSHGGVAVSVLGWPARVGWLVGAALGSLALAATMDHFTDAAAPYVDSSIAGFSVAAQILMSVRKIENWVLWIAVDAVAVVLFISRELYVTAGLYAVFFGLASIGLWGWWREYQRGGE